MLLVVEIWSEGFVEEVVAGARGALVNGPDFPAEFEEFGFVRIDGAGSDKEAICHFLDI